MRNKENIDHVVRSKHAITSLSQGSEISTLCSDRSMHEKKSNNHFQFLSDNYISMIN